MHQFPFNRARPWAGLGPATAGAGRVTTVAVVVVRTTGEGDAAAACGASTQGDAEWELAAIERRGMQLGRIPP